MNRAIISAIQGQRTLTFNYHGERRTVEPHCYGLDTKGHEALRAFQRGSKGWRLFHVSEIAGLVDVGEGFDGPRPDYKRNDKGMSRIYAQL